MFDVVFFQTPSGKAPVLEWLRALDKADRLTIGDDLRTVQFGYPVGMPLCRSLSGGLWEVRTNLSSHREARIIFFQRGAKIVIVNGFMKKTQKTSDAELELARKRKAAYERNSPN